MPAAAIEFRAVTFTRQGTTPVLDRFDLSVEAGEVLALVGRSGAGKTTLVNLLPRFYDVSSGAIFVDGVDIRHVTLKSLRQQIGIVTQDTVLFDDSIGRNIAYGSPDAAPAEIEAAARAANAHDFVAAMPHGYDTMIGERGQRLSGGQRQRIAIARALALQPKIIIADEAVSALDVSVQARILDLLEEIQQRLRLTMLFITHDLRVAARMCNRIIVMQHGRIVEEAPVAELFRSPKQDYTRSLLSAAPGRGFRFGALQG